MKLNLECMLKSKMYDFFVIFLFKTFAREKCQDILKKYTKKNLEIITPILKTILPLLKIKNFWLKRLDTTSLEPTNQMQ